MPAFNSDEPHDQTHDLERVTNAVTAATDKRKDDASMAHLGKQDHRPDRRFHIARLHSGSFSLEQVLVNVIAFGGL